MTHIDAKQSSADPFAEIMSQVEISGADGWNRASGTPRQLAANNDVDAVKAWLSCFADKRTTFDSYRKEAERLLLWCAHQRGVPLSSLTHEDWLAYKNFLKDPQPRARWVSGDGRKHARTDPKWRPFAGPLSESSQRQAAVILNALFSWLVQAGYLTANPLALTRERRRRQPARVTRYLDDDLWTEVKATVDLLPDATPRQREHYLRLRWLITLCYVCGLRISEVSCNTMGGFFRRRDQDGRDRWWLEIRGKGDNLRIVPATSELMTELGHYRQALGHPQLPAPGESTPLLLPIGGKNRAMTRGGIHTIVKDVFRSTSKRLRARGSEFVSRAELIEQASTHWLRHTAGSHMANNNVDLRHVRDNLGHGSISTTNIYLHSSDLARHIETDTRHKVRW